MSLLSGVVVHPLALLNLSDRLHRDAALGQSEHRETQIGGLLGVYDEKSKTSSIMMSFEIVELDEEKLSARLKLFEEAYPHLELVGFYSVSGTDESFSQIKRLGSQCGKNGYVYLDLEGLSKTAEDDTLPLKAFFVGLEGIFEVKTVEIKTIPVEKVGLNTINRLKDDSTAAGGDGDVPATVKMVEDVKIASKDAVEVLSKKVETIIDYLRGVDEGNCDDEGDYYATVKAAGDLVIAMKKVKQDGAPGAGTVEYGEKLAALATVNESLILENLRGFEEFGLVSGSLR